MYKVSGSPWNRSTKDIWETIYENCCLQTCALIYDMCICEDMYALKKRYMGRLDSAYLLGYWCQPPSHLHKSRNDTFTIKNRHILVMKLFVGFLSFKVCLFFFIFRKCENKKSPLVSSART